MGAAFATYFNVATKFHVQIAEVCQGRVTWDQLKNNFRMQQVPAQTKQNLDMLIAALEQAARSECSTSEEERFFRTLKRMLSGRQVEWVELQNMLQERTATPNSEGFAYNMLGNVPELDSFGGKVVTFLREFQQANHSFPR